LQSLLSPHGPAGTLLGFAKNHRLTLFVSRYILGELREVALRPNVQRKYKLTPEVVERFCEDVAELAAFVEFVPHVFDFPRDPEDAHYIDLAVAAGAKLIVSRDKDLLSLRDTTSPEGRDFRARFPTIEILTPPELLTLLASS
jgi:putative PIN family toxin of toxin-antitoxin system